MTQLIISTICQKMANFPQNKNKKKCLLNHVFLATANTAAAVVHVSATAASALCNEPAEGAAGGEDAHSAS